MIKRAVSMAFVLATWLCAGWLAPALSDPLVAVTSSPRGAKLTVAGKLVAILRTPNAELSPRERAELAAERIESAIARGAGAGAVHVEARGERWGLLVGDALVMFATPDEAEERHEKPEVTARRWAANLKAALQGIRHTAGGPNARRRTANVGDKGGRRSTMQAVRAPKTTLEAAEHSVTVPVGEVRTVELLGSAKGAITVRVEGDEGIEASVVDGKAEISLRARAVGRASVRVQREGKETAFRVWSKKYAGTLGEAPTVQVTGKPAPAALVRRLALESALLGVAREPGATARLAGGPTGVTALTSGETAQVAFPVLVTGNGYIERKLTSRVSVRNVALPEQDPSVLLYSNDPETIREFGTVFDGLVNNQHPVRMLFHHQNRMGRTFRLQVHLINPGGDPVEVQVVEADAGPYIDPIQAGHRAGARYMEASVRDVGYVATVPPHSSRSVYSASVGNLLTVSGIYNFRVISGGPLVAEVTATQTPTTPLIRDDLVAAAQEEPHTYPHPQKNVRQKYSVGQRWTFVPVGREAITGKTANRRLHGNYGVLYQITVALDNPTDEPRTVRVLLAPEAGWVRGAFVIEGRVIEAPQLHPPNEALLWSVRLEAREQRTLNIRAMPVGGSSYPISLVVRS
jgi:hypothetical protein